ncbi:unnamed protein product [Mycena citricolor]|uniref:Secreted protein n=1 Tax=Mycena citricolor TaxID=2018698 RepID=A0AAD2HRN1_9AGAR|nr:unnamed protein product [Mycena citricolor]
MSEDCFLIFCICFDLLSCCSPFCEDSCPWIMGSCVSKQHGGGCMYSAPAIFLDTNQLQQAVALDKKRYHSSSSLFP